MISAEVTVRRADPRAQPAWPEEEARALASLRGRLFGRFDPPRRLHRYVLLELLGSGGGGTVYAAYDPQLDRKVAIKLLRGLADHRAQLRLVREAQALAKLAHPNVVAVFDVGTYDPTPDATDPPIVRAADPVVFIVMEYVDGATLAEWLRGERSPKAVLAQFLAAGRGLAAAHALGIVHRDFKPQNVVVGRDGRPRVLDFGLSRIVASALGPTVQPQPGPTFLEDSSSDHIHSLTDAGTVMGTPAYMAPEQHIGALVDARADQFAFCVALFEALHGHRPFVGANLGELIRAKRDGALRAVASRVPRRIERALARGLSPDPESRHPDLAALLAELEPRRGRAWAWIGAAIALLVLALAWLGESRRAVLTTCEGASGELALAWNESRRADIELAFERSDDPLAQADSADVLGALDRWGEAWMGARTETCVLGSSNGPDEEIVRRRSVCLEHGLASARTTIDLLAAADSRTLGWSRDIVQSLPAVERCRDDELLAHEAIPPDVGSTDAVGRVMANLVALRTRVLTGEERRAIAIGRSVVADADASGHPPSRVRARYGLAWALSRAGELAEAESHLRAGWLIAEAQRLDDLQIRGALDLSGVLRDRGRTGEADAMLEAAAAKASRISPSPGLASDFAVQRGRALLDAGRIDLAVASFEEALAMRVTLYGRDHVAVAWTSMDLARAHAAAGAVDEMRSHLQHAADVLGRSRPTTGNAHAELMAGQAELSALEGRPADAIARLVTLDALATAGALGDPVIHARARNGLAAAWLALDRNDLAAAVIDAEPERCGRALGPTHRVCIDALDLRRRVAVLNGDLDRALVDAQSAATLADATLPEGHPRRAALREALMDTRAAAHARP